LFSKIIKNENDKKILLKAIVINNIE